MSGALLFLADVEAFATSPIFWTKMSLVGLLIGATCVTARLDAALRRDCNDGGGVHDERRWRRRRAGAIVTALLWFGLVLVGAALASH